MELAESEMYRSMKNSPKHQAHSRNSSGHNSSDNESHYSERLDDEEFPNLSPKSYKRIYTKNQNLEHLNPDAELKNVLMSVEDRAILEKVNLQSKFHEDLEKFSPSIRNQSFFGEVITHRNGISTSRRPSLKPVVMRNQHLETASFKAYNSSVMVGTVVQSPASQKLKKAVNRILQELREQKQVDCITFQGSSISIVEHINGARRGWIIKYNSMNYRIWNTFVYITMLYMLIRYSLV